MIEWIKFNFTNTRFEVWHRNNALTKRMFCMSKTKKQYFSIVTISRFLVHWNTHRWLGKKTLRRYLLFIFVVHSIKVRPPLNVSVDISLRCSTSHHSLVIIKSRIVFLYLFVDSIQFDCCRFDILSRYISTWKIVIIITNIEILTFVNVLLARQRRTPQQVWIAVNDQG